MAQQVRERVPNDLEPFGILRCDDLDACVLFDEIAQIDQLAVYLSGHRGLRKAGPISAAILAVLTGSLYVR